MGSNGTKYKVTVIAGFLFCWMQPELIAQRLPVPDALTMDNGLSFRHISAITQDKDGLMWFGTLNGLNRYDGYRFVNFGGNATGNNQFPVREFAKDGILFQNDSILWAIADFRLWSMNIRSLGRKQVPGIEGRVLKMVAGKNKDFWLVTDNEMEQVLWHYTVTNGFKKAGSVPHLRMDFTDIKLDTSGAVWWSTITKGLQQYSPAGKLVSEAKIDSFLWYGTWMYFNDMFIDSRNRLFVFSANKPGGLQIWRYHPESGRKELFSEELKDISSPAAFEDSEGSIWFAKKGGLLQLQPDGQLNDFTDLLHQSLDFTAVVTLYEDRTNTLWIGTDGGLLKLPVRKTYFSTYFSRKNTGWGNAIRGICESPGGDLFFFCEMGEEGLYHLDKKSGKIEKISLGLKGEAYRTKLELANFLVFDQKRNCIWTMTETLLKINLSTQKIEPQAAVSFGRESSSLNPLALFPDGQVVLGNTLDKLALFDPESGYLKDLFTTQGRTYSGIYPKVLLAQGNDSIWVGTFNKGLFLFNRKGDLLKHYSTDSAPALSSNHIICLYPDENRQQIWAGTFGGGICLIDLKTGNLRVLNKQNGLADNNVASILGHGDNLWVGTFNGLSCFNRIEETFQNFYSTDGLTNNEFNFTSACKSRDGRMYFGGLNGINAFYPTDLLQQFPNPPLQLTRFTKYNQRSDSLIDIRVSGLSGEVVTLSPDISFFTLEWTLPNYFNPDKNQYYSWMEGLEKDWTYLGHTPGIRFNKLPPGKYTFHLKGKDSRGNWSERPLAVTIHVIRPWWTRWWAYGLYFMVMAIAVAVLRKRELGRIHLRNNLEKEQREAQKLAELDLSKSRFFANLSHEFRTPLTVILGMSEEIKEPKSARQLIRQSGRNLLRLVNQMLDFSKLEAGKLTLNLQSGDLAAYLHYLVESFHSLAAYKNVTLHYEPSVEVLEMEFDEEKIQHIVSNLLSNALKFTPRNGRVTVTLSCTGQVVCIRVEDTGIGIPAAQLPRIFERYYQVNDPISKGEPGTGIGLAFTKELVEMMDGKIEVESTMGAGTVFRVLLPVIKTTGLVNPAVPSMVRVPASNQAEPALVSAENRDNQDRHTLLIIEDNPEVVTYISNLLEKDYIITMAENGETGIEKALEQIPDIIICDVMMPVKDGFAVTQFLKNDDRTSHIPVILLTAKADVDSRLIGLTRGADAYLAKPFDKKELLVRLEQLILLRKKLQARYAQFTRPQPTEDIGLRIEDTFLQKVNSIIETHMDKPEFGVDELCLAIGISRPQLFRKLKALTDKSIVSYLRSVRLQKAKELLQEGKLNISEIAYEVGFNDPLYFSRAFSREFGIPPTSLRK
jgi:signal transduction histidine kinase/CheY-like chemotaxis protein/AraC-like DNA-binding protein/sugar lactone lactonase YvrE